MKTMKFNFNKKTHLLLIREIVYNAIMYTERTEFLNNFIDNLLKENNCSSKEALYNKIDAEINK